MSLRLGESGISVFPEVTPAMLAAGVAEFGLIDRSSPVDGASVWVADIYRAMERARVLGVAG